MKWFSCKSCGREAEIDRKLKALEEAEYQARIIKKQYLCPPNVPMFHVPPAVSYNRSKYGGKEVEVYQPSFGEARKGITLSITEAKELRDFLNNVFPVEEVAK